MEISKTKILAYALAFIAYAFTGYGANLISNLRDAVIAAEDFFSYFIKNSEDIGKKLQEANRILTGTLEDCKFTCPSGGTPVKNKYHKPSYNGCGTDILNFEFSKHMTLVDLTECCNKHDLCYDTCNNLKKDCDDGFKKCLEKVCEKLARVEPLTKACKAAVSLIKGPMTFGCKSYLESQKKSCYCPNDDKKRKFTPGGEL